MRRYPVLNQQTYTNGDHSIVPIRHEDRYDIMKWRNEQIYHLRQKLPLTEDEQDLYFENVVAQLFNQQKPDQLLFSFIYKKDCVGYGGLVHINWIDKHAEISFIMNTSLEKDFFIANWKAYLPLIEQVAFEELSFKKIYTYAFDLRPKLYDALLESNYCEEARLKDHCVIGNCFRDVLIHSKFNSNVNYIFRDVCENDVKTIFDWASDNEVRKQAFDDDDILWEDHLKWFSNKLKSDSVMMILVDEIYESNVGQVRLDWSETDKAWVIDYSVDKNQRGKGVATLMISLLIKQINKRPLLAHVKKTNNASLKVFRKLGFTNTSDQNNIATYRLN